MVIDTVTLATITSAVSVLGNEFVKGIATEAGKSAWAAIKALFGWTSDPAPAEIPQRVADVLTTSPEMADKLLGLLRNHEAGTAAAIVGKIEAPGGKVIVAQNIVVDRFQM